MIAEFSAWEGLLGGALIGLSASVLMLLKGRIAGISGILGGVIERSQQMGWQAPFVLGLILAWPLYTVSHGPIPFEINDNLLLIAIAGMLVGIGTRLGSGCTSGHGVCGISRGSARSIIATVVFMAVAIVTVWLKRAITGEAL